MHDDASALTVLEVEEELLLWLGEEITPRQAVSAAGQGDGGGAGDIMYNNERFAWCWKWKKSVRCGWGEEITLRPAVGAVGRGDGGGAGDM